MTTQNNLADYEVYIPKVAALLANVPEIQQLFHDLTPGYQREWARYIFGAKTRATQDHHLETMQVILKAGFKSKRAYDSQKKA